MVALSLGRAFVLLLSVWCVRLPVPVESTDPRTTSGAAYALPSLGRRARRLLTRHLNSVWGPENPGACACAASGVRRAAARRKPRHRSWCLFCRQILNRLCGYAGVRIGEAKRPGPGAGDSSANVSDSPPKRTRRQLQYVKYDAVNFDGDSLALHESCARVLRSAARKWAETRSFVIGTFSNPAITPTDEWQCSCLCHAHETCHASQGTCYRFSGILDGSVYRLRVEKAGQCGETPRKNRAAATKLYKDDQPTAAERLRVLQARKELLSTLRKATPGAVVKRLEARNVSVAAVRVKAILRAAKKDPDKLGFVESQESFEEFIETIPDMSFVHVQKEPFQWVCTLPAFMDSLQELACSASPSPSGGKIFITADFTFRLAVMGYSYGIVSTLLAVVLIICSAFCLVCLKKTSQICGFSLTTEASVSSAASSPPTLYLPGRWSSPALQRRILRSTFTCSERFARPWRNVRFHSRHSYTSRLACVQASAGSFTCRIK